MRQVVLDTETTGIEISAGNRLVEIGCVEICERALSGRRFQTYLNPDRDSEPGALAVHGLSTEFLADKPRFADVVDEFLRFIEGAEILIHNASFDLGFLNHELKLCERSECWPLEQHHPVLDTLALARERHPGQRNSLDALCKRYGVDNSGRHYHGALLDAHLLADVYLAMTAGQGALDLAPVAGASAQLVLTTGGNRQFPVRMANSEERAIHTQRIAALEKKSGKPSLWQEWL